MKFKHIILTLISILLIIGGLYGYEKRQEKNSIEELKNSIVRESTNFFGNENIIINQDDINNILGHYLREKSKKEIYYLPLQGSNQGKFLITGADYNSFTPINLEWVKDKNYYYLVGKKTDIVSGNNPEIKGGGNYVIDDKNVYDGGGNLLSGIDRNTFQILGSYYAKDKNNIYVGGNIISGADYSSFNLLKSMYAKDKNNIYLLKNVLTGIDFDTFEEMYPPIKDGLLYYDAKDKDGYYLGGKAVK